MASSFPSISQTLAYFESHDPAKLAAEEKAHQDSLTECLHILTSSDPPNVLSSHYKAVVSQAPRPEVLPQSARKQEAREKPLFSETVLSSTSQHSTITVPHRHRDSPFSEIEVTALCNDNLGIEVEVQGLKSSLGSGMRSLKV